MTTHKNIHPQSTHSHRPCGVMDLALTKKTLKINSKHFKTYFDLKQSIEFIQDFLSLPLGDWATSSSTNQQLTKTLPAKQVPSSSSSSCARSRNFPGTAMGVASTPLCESNKNTVKTELEGFKTELRESCLLFQRRYPVGFHCILLVKFQRRSSSWLALAAVAEVRNNLSIR